MKNLITRVGNHEIVNEGDFKYVIKKDESKGMRVPVTIYADENLVSKMALDRTIDQAANVATLRGVVKHVVVLPDGHEGYGFPVARCHLAEQGLAFPEPAPEPCHVGLHTCLVDEDKT